MSINERRTQHIWKELGDVDRTDVWQIVIELSWIFRSKTSTWGRIIGYFHIANDQVFCIHTKYIPQQSSLVHWEKAAETIGNFLKLKFFSIHHAADYVSRWGLSLCICGLKLRRQPCWDLSKKQFNYWSDLRKEQQYAQQGWSVGSHERLAWWSSRVHHQLQETLDKSLNPLATISSFAKWA